MKQPIKHFENQILKNIKFVGVTFDPDSFKNGED